MDTNIKYGSKDTEIGGRALKFHASLRLDIKRSGFIKPTKDGDPIGIETTVKTVKNKTMIPFKQVTIPIIFGEGISYSRSLFEALLNKKIINRNGNTYSLVYTKKGEKITLAETGAEKFIKKLKVLTEKPNIRVKLERKLDQQ